MRILIITLYLPYPPNSGGQIRSYNLIKNLSKKHKITLVSLIKKGEEQYASEMEKYCDKVIYFYRHENPWTMSNILKTGFSLYPFLVMRNFTPEVKKFLQKELKNESYDLIHVETFYLMPHVPKTKIPILLVDQTIEFAVYQHYVDTYRFWFLRPLLYIDVFKLKYWETKFWREAAMVGAVSETDKQKMLSLVPGIKVGIIPNAPGEDLANLYKKRKPNFNHPVIFYQSNFHWLQNIEGANVLVNDVFPKILEQVPNAVCLIAGQNAKGKVDHLKRDGVEIVDLPTWDVEGVVKSYERGTIFLAPLHGPGGTRLKILGAMTSGMPVVTTTIGATGLDVTDGEDIMIAESPDDLAKKVVELLDNPSLYWKVVKNAKKLIEKKYDWEAISKKLNTTYEETAKKK